MSSNRILVAAIDDSRIVISASEICSSFLKELGFKKSSGAFVYSFYKKGHGWISERTASIFGALYDFGAVFCSDPRSYGPKEILEEFVDRGWLKL